MKKKYLLTFTLAAGLLTLTACNNGKAIVESDAGNISQDEFYQTLKDRYGESTLKELVYKQVLSDKYKVSDKEVDNALKKYKDAYGDNFQSWLAQMGISSEDKLKDILKFSLLQEKAAKDKIKVTNDELKEQYGIETKTVTARHILVADEETAKQVKQRLDNGEDFAALAKELSIDTATAKKGGDLGELNPDQLDREFTVAAYKLKENEISDPVKTDYGYHIIQATKVTEKKDVKPFDKMKSELEDKVKQSKLDSTTVQKAVDEAVKNADVKINDKDLKDILKNSVETGSKK